MILQSIKMALKSILASKMRSFLTMLGIIIGVMALVVLVSLVTSATSSVASSISSMGNDLFTVSIRDDGGEPIALDELDKLIASENLAQAAPQFLSSASVRKGTSSIRVNVIGTTNAYFNIMNNKLAAGRLISLPDVKNGTHVAVLSNEAAAELFENVVINDIIGRTFRTDDMLYTVIGVLEKSDSVTAIGQQSYAIYVPFSLSLRLAGSAAVTNFYATAIDNNSIDAAEIDLNLALLQRFNGNTDAYYVQSMRTLSETLSSVQDTFALLLGGIAAISLLVGGIGIMNIMLVSVTERTREIGIRKAIGATRSSIMAQFLLEALVICLIGCAIGVAASAIVVLVVNLVSIYGSAAASSGSVTFSMPYSLSGTVVLASVIFSTLIGVVFGLYPAGKAARMQPIQALRYE
ncbi:MAG: ABC transporter permease [Coriobacteriales bacterium]|jgi:putative ABC transport system permease protein|nr:ABC transporter permease [Coriobacteriales bacterium]